MEVTITNTDIWLFEQLNEVNLIPTGEIDPKNHMLHTGEYSAVSTFLDRTARRPWRVWFARM
jgi:hypothetical protein